MMTRSGSAAHLLGGRCHFCGGSGDDGYGHTCGVCGGTGQCAGSRNGRMGVVPTSPYPRRPCPRHGTALAGGPVEFWCPRGHRVPAADLSLEVAR